MWFSGVRPGQPAVLLGLLLLGRVKAGYDLNVTSEDSIKAVAADMAYNMMTFYHGNESGQTPGLLPDPYYWWEGGALMGALIDYWYYTGDDQYNNLTTQGLLFQVGDTNDYMPANQTLTEGNDDQGFWGMAVMSAAEYNFPNPPADEPQWLALAEAVFNDQAARWDTEYCQGGLRWQIFTWNTGYDYKNSISQACLFNLAARLALYTGNATYAEWATRTWDWMRLVEFIDDSYYVYDGAHITTNCTDITVYQFSYNAGAFLLGAAAMYNYSSLIGDDANASVWYDHVDGMLNGTMVFFTGDNSDIMTEIACETVYLCDTDQQSFKAYLSRWMAATTKWAPWTYDTILPLLQTSAVAAAKQCSGGSTNLCGLRWIDDGVWDNTTGVGQQMAAMEVTLGTMVRQVSAPVTKDTGGTSNGSTADSGGSSSSGSSSSDSSVEKSVTTRTITAGDRAGAGILTAFVLISLLAGLTFMMLDETDPRTTLDMAIALRSGRKLSKQGVVDGGSTTAVVLSWLDKGKETISTFSLVKRGGSTDMLGGSEASGIEIGVLPPSVVKSSTVAGVDEAEQSPAQPARLSQLSHLSHLSQLGFLKKK